jgi:hypothetical protein
MRDRFPGFYRPTKDEFDAFFERGLICPDASVLLTLYKVSEATRDAVFAVFRELGDRLWLPHQVVLEFQRGRQTAIREQEEVYEELEKDLGGFPDLLMKKVRRYHPRIDREEFREVIDAAIAEIKGHLEALHEVHPNPLPGDDILGADVVRDQLEEIVDGRIGSALDWDEVERQGKHRYPRLVPPGYADADKKGGREYGDLAIWLELLAEAGDRKIPVLFITEDAKEDWWMREGAKTIGPRSELVQEMVDEAKCDFWMYRFEPFLSRAAEHFDIELGAGVSAEVAEAQEPQITPPQWWQWNQGPLFPTASGAMASSRDPGGTTFHFSPSNPAVLNASLFPASELNWQLPVRSEVELTGDAAEIRLHRSPTALVMDLTCSVTDPEGKTTASGRAVQVERTVEVSYPFGGGGKELRPGGYSYRWAESPGAGGLVTVISQGDFVVPG